MRLSIPTLILAAGLTSSAANVDTSSSTAQSAVSPFLEQNRAAVELLPEACSLVACLGLGTTFTCILQALQARDLTKLAQCLTTGIAGICSCAECIPILGGLLDSTGLCPTTAGGGSGNGGSSTSAIPTLPNTFVTSTMRSAASTDLIITMVPTPSV